MFKVIELVDSDEELPMPNVQSSQLSLDSVYPPQIVGESTTSELNSKQKPDEVGSFCPTASAPISENCEDNTNTTQAQPNYAQPRVRHRRKSTQRVRSSSDMEFATLPIEINVEGALKNKSIRKSKPSKTAPNILSPKQPTSEDLFNENFDVFLNHNETKAVIKEIAMQRLRINTLLTLNGMPEINFSLYTQPERLSFQLEDRFEQHRIRRQSAANQLSNQGENA